MRRACFATNPVVCKRRLALAFGLINSRSREESVRGATACSSRDNAGEDTFVCCQACLSKTCGLSSRMSFPHFSQNCCCRAGTLSQCCGLHFGVIERYGGKPIGITTGNAARACRNRIEETTLDKLYIYNHQGGTKLRTKIELLKNSSFAPCQLGPKMGKDKTVLTIT